MIDPVMLRVTAGSLAAACEEMGEVLVRAAHSANIKERRDCSTGVFDAAGQMTMQAEHIPVHLGAMPASVAAVVTLPQAPGDAWILNDPFQGGTHLPDITIVTPIFAADGAHLGYAACRAHHADVGGREPGSMPADSRTLEEEGVVIPPTLLAAGGIVDQALLESLITQMRHPDQRAADLRAQLAACRRGEVRVREFAARYGIAALRRGDRRRARLRRATRPGGNRRTARPASSTPRTCLKPTPTARPTTSRCA